MSSELINFQSGNQILHGKLHLLDKQAASVIFLPGISGKALTDRFDYLGEAFNIAGFNFFRFNFRGYEDDRSVDDSCLTEELEDIRNAILYLESEGLTLQRFGIVSKSFGNIKTFLLDDKRLGCAGLLAPAAYFGEVSKVDELKNKPYGEIEHISDIVIDNKILSSWNVPTLIIHGDQDSMVNIKNSEYIFDHLSGKKEFKVIPGGQHSLDEDEGQKQAVIKYLTTFFKENLLTN